MKWKCAICGEVFEGDTPPVPCPVCGAGEQAFSVLEGAIQWKCAVCGEVFEGSEPPVPCPVCGAKRDAFIQVQQQPNESYRRDVAERYLIIGGGVAALEAVKAIRKRNHLAKITMVCKEQVIPYNRPGLSDVIGDDLSFAAIALEEYSWYGQNGVELICDSYAEQIDVEHQKVLLHNGDQLRYDKLCLAVGANAFNPLQRSETSIPVSVLRTYMDANTIIEQACGKAVIVMGGGILGLEAAVALRERGCQVTVCERGKYILANQSDAYVSVKLAEKFEAAGIRIRTSVSIACADETGVVLSTGERIPAEFVLVSAGIRSELTLAKAIGLPCEKGILVNDRMETAYSNIYAAGDCAQWNGKVAGLWNVAANQGAVAGAAMTGDPEVSYRPSVPATAFESLGISFFSCGTITGERLMTVTREDAFSGAYRKLLFSQNCLVGAVFFGDTSNSAKTIGMVESMTAYPAALELL